MRKDSDNFDVEAWIKEAERRAKAEGKGLTQNEVEQHFADRRKKRQSKS